MLGIRQLNTTPELKAAWRVFEARRLRGRRAGSAIASTFITENDSICSSSPQFF